MTYIEFFSKNTAENICGSLVSPPERVVLIGDKKTLLEKHAANYQKVLEGRGHKVEFLCRAVNRNNLESITTVLTELMESYADCAFDLTGGDELYLVAVGIISERYKERHIQTHRFNIRNGTVTDCDKDGKTIMENNRLQMSVEENIRIYGGEIIYSDVKKRGTYRWDMNEEFRADLMQMWSICKENPRLWNKQMTMLEVANELCHDDGLLTFAIVDDIAAKLEKKRSELVFSETLIGKLYAKGLITECDYDETDMLYMAFKNEQIKRCLTKAGQVLEMIVYMAALDAKDSANKTVYNDVVNGVYIDWDGEIHTEEYAVDTENEIDVMMMHGIVPVFVSCKNGNVEMEELYKLNTVATRFGGQYAKKVLVASCLDTESDFGEHFKKRADDMEIRLVTGIRSMDAVALNKAVRGFWSTGDPAHRV